VNVKITCFAIDQDRVRNNCKFTVAKLSYTSSQVSTGIGDDLWPVFHPGIYPGHLGELSLAIPS